MPVLTSGGLTLDIAYEHVLSQARRSTGFSITAPGGSAARTGDWLGLDWDLHSGSNTKWRHRLDRISLGFSGGPLEVTIGRQAVSWATTLILTPADPFAPFNPSDPFREYRGGIDALRVKLFTGPFSEIEAVVRPTETAFGTTVTALGRVQTSRGGWAFGTWAGILHDQPAGALFATGALETNAIRAEVAIREHPNDEVAVRGAIGLDRFFTPGGKDVYFAVELQYDGFGAQNTSKLLETMSSKPFIQGDMQTIGKWTVASQLSYQIHPLVGVSGLALVNARDRSVLVSPGLNWSATGSLTVTAAAFRGLGTELTSPGTLGLGSEFGFIPAIGYISASWFF
tara:strand:+ start:10933 stop:11955 length:1023 start_codon:yes stop_codon:yes gene_type:complete